MREGNGTLVFNDIAQRYVIVAEEQDSESYDWDIDAILLTEQGTILWYDDSGCSCDGPYECMTDLFEIKDNQTWNQAKQSGLTHDLLKEASALLMLTREQRSQKAMEELGVPTPVVNQHQAIYFPETDTVHINDRVYVRANRDYLRELEEWAREGAQILLDARDQVRGDYAKYVAWQSRLDWHRGRSPVAPAA